MQMKNLSFLFILSMPFFTSCKKKGCFDSEGKVIMVTRNIAAFHQVELIDNINLILTQDTVEQIKIEAGENLQPNISTDVQNGILTIRNNTACNWIRKLSETINVYLS